MPGLLNWHFKMMQAVVWSMGFNLSPFVTLNCGAEEQEEAIYKLLVSSGVRELAAFPSPFFFHNSGCLGW